MLSKWQLRVEIHNPAMNAQCTRWVMWTSSLHTLSFAGAVATPTWKASWVICVLQSHPTFAVPFHVTRHRICRMFLRVCSARFAVSPEAHFTLGVVSTCEGKQNKIQKCHVGPLLHTPTKHCPTSRNYFPCVIHIPRSNWHCETGSSDMFIWMSKYLSKPRHVGMDGTTIFTGTELTRNIYEHLCLQHLAAEIRSL